MILVRKETTPDDIHGIVVAQGVLTARGGMTSHAAVVARGLGKPCVAGAEEIEVDADAPLFRAAGVEVREGDVITIDGSRGEVMQGAMPLVPPQINRGLPDRSPAGPTRCAACGCAPTPTRRPTPRRRASSAPRASASAAPSTCSSATSGWR